MRSTIMNEMTEVTIDMPKATEGSSCGLNGNSSSVNSSSENVTRMDPKFYTAAVEGNIAAFEEKGEDIERMLTPNKNTILHIHLTASSVLEAFVREILSMCPTLLTKVNAKGETLLHIAARYGHSMIVRQLIESAKTLPKAEKTLIRAISNNKDTALHEAVCFRHTDVVDILTQEDPHISDFVNSDGETPLYVATEREYWDVALKILDNCKSPNQDGPNSRTALHVAVIRNNKEIVSKLLTRTSVKQADENGWVPLHLASLRSSADMTEMLLKYDRNIAYMRDKRGRTALHFAARCGHVKVMEKIIKFFPDCTELVDEKGYNALHYAAIGGKPSVADAARVILENTSLSNLYNEKDDNGNTPLHHLAATLTPTSINALDHHPLLEGRSRVDTMAFNKQNQTPTDVAFNTLRRASSSEEKPWSNLAGKLEEIGARYGGRIIINKNGTKKKLEQTHKHDSAVVEKEKKREETHGSASVERKKKQEKSDEFEKDPFFSRLRETNFVVATLIATVTFAAGFTMPGGTIQEHDNLEKGSPILRHNPAFQAFVITDTISFVLSASAVLFQIFSSVTLDDNDLIAKFMGIALMLTTLALVFMIIAFGTGTYAVLATSKVLAVVTIVIGLSFFFAFAIFFGMVGTMYSPSDDSEDSEPIRDEQCGHIFPKPDPILEAEDIQLIEYDCL